MIKQELEALVEAANRRYTNPERNTVIGDAVGARPRFELYHFFLSLCSYKLRTVLDEKETAYVSHDIDILPPNMENYYPEHVRLRLKGADGMNWGLVAGYTGRSATETEGFDPCVVPTLVDHEAGIVLVNSKRMCLYLDAEIDTGTELVPADIREDVIRQMDIVDRTPHVAVLYGVHPDDDRRPDFIREGMVGVHDFKIAKVRENMALVGDDPELIAAYESKIAKESAAKEFVHTESSMRSAVQEFRDIIARLERDLEDSRGEWLFDDRFTMADLFWAISLFRIQWVGLGQIYESDAGEKRFPRVADYRTRLWERPSVRRAAIHWPNHPPSKYMTDYYPPQ